MIPSVIYSNSNRYLVVRYPMSLSGMVCVVCMVCMHGTWYADDVWYDTTV